MWCELKRATSVDCEKFPTYACLESNSPLHLGSKSPLMILHPKQIQSHDFLRKVCRCVLNKQNQNTFCNILSERADTWRKRWTDWETKRLLLLFMSNLFKPLSLWKISLIKFGSHQQQRMSCISLAREQPTQKITGCQLKRPRVPTSVSLLYACITHFKDNRFSERSAWGLEELTCINTQNTQPASWFISLPEYSGGCGLVGMCGWICVSDLKFPSFQGFRSEKY